MMGLIRLIKPIKYLTDALLRNRFSGITDTRANVVSTVLQQNIDASVFVSIFYRIVQKIDPDLL